MDLYHTEFTQQGLRQSEKGFAGLYHQLEQRFRQAGAQKLNRLTIRASQSWAARYAHGLRICLGPMSSERSTVLGGRVVRGPDGNIVEVSLARTWASDNDVEKVADLKTLKRLDLSSTYITDAGVQRLGQVPALEELTLDTAEALTDAAASYLRANKSLRKLVLRGVDITDVGCRTWRRSRD